MEKVVVADQLHLLMDFLWRFSAEVVEGKDPAEFSFLKNALQRVASMRDGLTFCDHDLRYLSA